MKTFANTQVSDVYLYESFIKGVRWVNEFRDLIVDIAWCGQKEYENEIDFHRVDSWLYFDFVHDMECAFKSEPLTMGGLEITNFFFTKDATTWSVAFGFTNFHRGEITLKCSDFKFVVTERA